MRINPDFVIHKTERGAVLVAVGKAGEKFHGIITLNATGLFIVEQLNKETDYETLLSSFLDEYDIDKETAERDLNAFLSKLESAGAILN